MKGCGPICGARAGAGYLKYRFWLLLLFSMASKEPMPRYFLSLTPSEKKYSPGASVVAASREPIITVVVAGPGQWL